MLVALKITALTCVTASLAVLVVGAAALAVLSLTVPVTAAASIAVGHALSFGPPAHTGGIDQDGWLLMWYQ